VTQFAVFADRDTRLEKACEIGLKVARSLWPTFGIAGAAWLKAGVFRWPAQIRKMPPSS